MIQLQDKISEIRIPYIHKFQDVAIYEIYIHKHDSTSYTVYSRFSNFEALNQKILCFLQETEQTKEGLLAPFPEKKIFNLNSSLLFERRVLFQNYLQKLCENSDLCCFEEFIRFLDPINGPNAEISFYMSVLLENKLTKRNSFFDTLETTDLHDDMTHLKITQTKFKEKTIFYVLEVKNTYLPETYNTWTVEKRYSEFHAFHEKLVVELRSSNPTCLLTLPIFPEKRGIFFNHFNREFIEKRKVMLEHYLQQLLLFKEVRRSKLLREFLGL